MQYTLNVNILLIWFMIIMTVFRNKKTQSTVNLPLKQHIVNIPSRGCRSQGYGGERIRVRGV